MAMDSNGLLDNLDNKKRFKLSHSESALIDSLFYRVFGAKNIKKSAIVCAYVVPVLPCFYRHHRFEKIAFLRIFFK